MVARGQGTDCRRVVCRARQRIGGGAAYGLRPQQVYARHSEKLDPDQLQLALDECAISIAHKQATAEKQTTAPHPQPEPGRRKSLPAHLPRIAVVIEPETTSCPCWTAACM